MQTVLAGKLCMHSHCVKEALQMAVFLQNSEHSRAAEVQNLWAVIRECTKRDVTSPEFAESASAKARVAIRARVVWWIESDVHLTICMQLELNVRCGHRPIV